MTSIDHFLRLYLASGTLEELQRIFPRLPLWPDVLIIIRGDSAYVRDDIMSWRESMSKVK